MVTGLLRDEPLQAGPSSTMNRLPAPPVGCETHQELGLNHAATPPGHRNEETGFEAHSFESTPT